jgi:hypothetical protein
VAVTIGSLLGIAVMAGTKPLREKRPIPDAPTVSVQQPQEGVMQIGEYTLFYSLTEGHGMICKPVNIQGG